METQFEGNRTRVRQLWLEAEEKNRKLPVQLARPELFRFLLGDQPSPKKNLPPLLATDAGKPIDPGRIPIRRLNRTEYNNTIRDLCLIEFEPAETFPPDDSSHGFDNIAEALTLSPLLMERYLDAAEAVVARTIITGKPTEPTVRIGFDQFITKGTNRPYRISLFTSEPLATEYRLAADGDYVLRVEGRPTAKDIPPIRMALLIDGKEVERLTFAITAVPWATATGMTTSTCRSSWRAREAARSAPGVTFATRATRR